VEGNEIESGSLLNVGAVLEKLRGSSLYKQFHWLGTVPSTQALAKQMGEENAPHGTLVWAEYQTGGRGRRGRIWEAAKGENLIFSLLLRSSFPADDLFWVTACLGLAVCQGLEAVASLAGMIKWPNDIFLEGNKVGGILTEARFDGSLTRYIVSGLGLNVNWNPQKAKEMPYPVTSVSREARASIKREDLLGEILQGFEREFSFLECGKRRHIEEAWLSRFILFGKRVIVIRDDGEFEGIVTGLRKDGALLIQRSNGIEEPVFAGDVSLRM